MFLGLWINFFHNFYRVPSHSHLVSHAATASSLPVSAGYIRFKSGNHVILLHASGMVAQRPVNGLECLTT